MAGNEAVTVEKDMEILEASFIYLLMKKEYRISRSIRMQWFLEQLNKTITVPCLEDLENETRRKEANIELLSVPDPELKVLSVIPHEQPREWKPDSSHMYKYLVTAHSTIIFLTYNYCIVYCLDMSPSLSAVDIQHGEVMIDGIFASLKKSLDGLTKPFKIPGSNFVFQPEICVTVIAHTPFFTTPAQQVLVQGWNVTQDNLNAFLRSVQQQLVRLEDTVAQVAGIAYDQLEALRAESEKLVGGLFEESSDGEMVPPPAARVPMVGPDAGFVNMLRYGMLALRLLPESSCKSLIVVTDGVVASPDVNVLDSVLAQLRSGTVSCSFLHVGSPFHPHCCSGLVPYVDLMQFVADATCGAYLNVIPEIESNSEGTMNLYHEKFLTWRFQRVNYGSLSLMSNCSPSNSSLVPPPPPTQAGEWHVSNACFYGSREPHLLRKKQEEDNLATTLLSVLCCRLREGYTVKNINIRDNHVEVGLVLPWKNHIYIDYTVRCQWPPSSSDNIGPGSSPVSVSGVSGPGLGPWVYSGTGIVHYSISIEAPYEFLHDITCLLKKPFKSQYRQAVVSRFWTTLKNLNRSDQLLVHLNSFPSNSATYTIPESIRSGMPVFYLPANSSIPVLSASDMTCPQFAQFWKPICLLEPSVWKKWLHTHRVGLVFQHDRPLPRHLHLANSSGRFQVIQCRQAAAALYSLLKDWSTFVLIENHSYVKLIFGDAEKPPTSFYIIRVTSKPPCVVINVAFLNGTPGFQRYKIVQQLKDCIAQLTFPQRPSVKEPPIRKVPSGKARSTAYPSRQQQQLQEQQSQQQSQQPSPTQQMAQQKQTPRKWSDVSCCVLLQKPVEKILIRYERMPSDFGTVVFPDGTTPLAPGCQTKTRTAASGLLTTLSRYLHHRRWIWAAQSGADAEEEAIARVLATITKMRLQEGFSFAHSTAGIINMVLEVQMKGETECEDKSRNDLRNLDKFEDAEWQDDLQSCVIQYVMFPPHTTSSNSKESGSEDDGTDDVEAPEVEGDGELQIITECWIEPQHGLVVNCPPERDYMEQLPYHKLADVICRVDAECISSLLTFQHLRLMCRNARVRSPVGISPLSGVARSSPLDPNGYSPNVITLSAQRIHYIPFAFNLMNILPKCQQAELLFSMFIQDLSLIGKPDSLALTADAPNKLLNELLFEQLKQNHDKELQLSLDDSMCFLKLLHERQRNGATYSLPVPLPHSRHMHRRTEEVEPSQTHSCANSVASEATMCDKLDKGPTHGPLLIPKWRCFLKGISSTHIVLTFLPASFSDLKLLMLPGQSLDDIHPSAVKLVVLPPGQTGTEVVSTGKTCEKTMWADTSCLLPVRNAQVLPSVENNASLLSRSSSCDTSCIFSKLPFASHLRSDSCSPLSFDQHEMTGDPPFRMRASSWDTVTKHASQSLDRIRTGSMDSKIKVKHHFIGPSLRLRDVATDIEEGKGFHEKRPFILSQKISSAAANPSPDLNSEHLLSHVPKYGAITLPVYVYDCPLAMLMDVLVYRDTDIECCNKSSKDLYQDRTRELHNNLDFLSNQKQCQFSVKEGAVGLKLGTSEGTVDEREGESDRVLVDEVVSLAAVKHTSPEPKSEDSDGVPDIPSLSQHCRVLSLAYYKVFVFSLFKSLHLNNAIHELDVQAAVDECEEALIEIDITNYIKTVCGHLKDFCMKARVDELKQRSNDNSPQHELKPVEENGESRPDAASNASLDHSDMEPKFPLSLLQTHAPCQQLELLHKQIKTKFMQILTVMFRPVPSHPEFYFCTPNWEKNQLGEQAQANEDEVHDQKACEVDDEMENMTFHSEIVEFRSEHGSAIGIVGMGTGATWEGQGGLVTPDDARTSLLSNMDSDSVSDLPDEEALEEVSPLFLHLTCSVRSKGKIRSCSVRVLPTCLGELVQTWDSDETELDLKELQVTLDILCLTLSEEGEADLLVEERVKHLSKVSPLFSPSMPRGEECDGLEVEEREANRPCGSIGSGECSGSPDPQLLGDRGHSHIFRLHQLKHLPDYQHKAVTTSVEKIEWLMRDEIAAFLLDTFPLDRNTLAFVANHVANSPDRPSCLMERVPLQFVFGPDQSLERFLQDFRNLSLNGYHLRQEDHLYYLVRDKHSASASASASVSASASDPVTGVIIRKKSGSVLLPSLGMKLQPIYQPGHMADHAELWTDIGRPPTVASSEDNVLVNEHFCQTLGPNIIPASGNLQPDDSDTDEESRPQDQPRPRPKAKQTDMAVVEAQSAEVNWRESAAQTSLETEMSRKTPRLENILRSTSGSDEKPCPEQSPLEGPSPRDGTSPHDELSPCEVSCPPEGPSPKEVHSPGDSSVGGMKHSQSYGFGEGSSRNGDAGGEREGDKIVAREVSPTRWCAVTAWQRKQQQQQQQQQQGTPGHRSEVSSIVESALGTEDGYEGYAGDSSDSADECDWLQDLDMRRPSLPNFWLIMKVNKDAVTTYFHCRCAEGEAEAPYKNVQRNVVASIKRLCKVVNQTMLLQNLHDTRMCDQLLEQEASEDIWKVGQVSGQGSGSEVLLLRTKSIEEGQRPDGEHETQGSYLEATLKFMPGWFACSVVWEAHFSLHPRLKTGPGKPGFSRGIQALRTVLNRFSVNNRNNMFVYQDNSGNVFYLRLHENVRSHSKSTPPGGIGRSDTEDNLPGPVSRSSSIVSLNARKHVAIPITSGGVTEEVLNQGDNRPRVQSFGERELYVQTSSTGLSSLTGLSSSEGNATTPTPCVTPQPMLSRPEDTVILKVHGISEAGPEVKEELVQVLQNRLDDAVLEMLSVMLARNPMCKLTPDDVHFIQKPFKGPESVIQFSIQSHALPHLQALAYYLRQNLLQFLYIPKYTDPRPECHFQDYSEPEASAKRVTESNLFLYNQSPASGSKGIACIAVAVVDSEGNLVQHLHYPKPYSSAHLEALNRSEFASLTLTKLYEPGGGTNRGLGPVALLEFRIWKQGRVNNESLTQKLHASVRHATWDLLMEFRLLTAPLGVSCPFGGHTSPSPSPTVTFSASVSASASPSTTVSPSATTFLPMANSEPSTPSKAKKIVRPSDSNSFLERTSNILSDSQIGSSAKACKLDSLESGESGLLHEIYHSTMRPWFEFGVELGVPAVRKHTVTLTVRHSLTVMVRELQNLVNVNAGDTSALVFWSHPISEEGEDMEYIPGPFMGPNFNAGAGLMIGMRGESSLCLLLGRNLIQWKACVSEDTGFDPDVLDPKSAQKAFQKFTPLLTSEQPPRFVPRQRLLLATLTNQQIIIYTYNWSKERVENLHQQTTQLGHWLSARSSLLTSIVTQKMGLFHNQELTRKQHNSNTSSNNSSSAVNESVTGTLSQTAGGKSVGRKVTNPYLSNLGDVEQLVKFPVGVGAAHKDSATRRVGFSTMLGAAMAWRDVFRDGKPRRPISKTPTNTDTVVCHVQQMLETRQFDRKADEQKKLYVMWQTRGATPNIPLAEDIIHLFKQNSRVIHYCLTPLLFLPRWRVQSAATRDHALSSMTSTPSAPTQVTPSGASVPTSMTKGHHSHHSRHHSGNSSTSVPGTVHTGTPSPTLRRQSDDKWHSALCANFVHEYKQYLQTLGFIPIQTEPASPRKGLKGAASSVKTAARDAEDGSNRRQSSGKQPEKEKNVCYLQKSLLGGILLFEILLCEPFFHAKLHALECSRLQSKSSSALISQFTLSFLDECDKIKILMHLHSFTYDYHLRSIHGYVSGHQAILKQGYHLTHFLDDFLKYYSKAPNFARNLVHADVLTVNDVTTPARQLFNYLLSHEKVYKMEVFRMVPVRVAAMNDSDAVEYDTDSVDNEYVLVQLESTPHVTYRDVHDMKHTDDFDATLIVAHDREDDSDQNSLHVKYYIILTSRRELYPKLEMERKLGKFCTVSTASVTTPLQLGHAGCTGELDSAGVGSGSRDWRGSQGADSDRDSLHTTISTEPEPQPESEPEREPQRDCESNHEPDHDADSSSEIVDNSDANPEQVVSVPTPTQHIEIRQEAVNYLGYYSSHEQLMQQLILEQAESAMRRICSMVSQGMVHCRTHLLWNKLQCSVSRDWERRRDRDRDELSPRDVFTGHGLTYTEFCELRNLAIVEPLSQLDSRLSPLLCQSLPWYQALAKVLMAKYLDHYRMFVAPDGNVQHIVILHPRYVEAFMMLSIDMQSSRGDLAVVYQKALPDKEHASTDCLEFCLADIQALVEGFVNACCFHLWRLFGVVGDGSEIMKVRDKHSCLRQGSNPQSQGHTIHSLPWCPY